jgi:signal peptidase I
VAVKEDASTAGATTLAPTSGSAGVATDAAQTRHAVFPIGASSPRPAAERPFGRRFLRDLTRGVAIVVLLHLFVVQISVVRGLSMEPSLLDGDRLIVDRISYALSDVDRFDVVVLRNPRNQEIDYVKRIVGLPGERVAIHSGIVEIDGEPIENSFEFVDDSATMSEIIVPDEHFFVLGDNRPVSCDSREFGLVQGELLKGKVRLRFWPLDRVKVF